jgi:hypothetical protein
MKKQLIGSHGFCCSSNLSDAHNLLPDSIVLTTALLDYSMNDVCLVM